MTIQQNIVPSSKYALKCPHAMTPIGICVHNTANDASAKNEISYMVGNSLQTSFHLAVDDIEAWQGLPLNRNGWHAGDGSNGEGNRKYIGIEICYSKSGGDRFTKSEDNAAQLIADLLKERNWGTEKVKKHQDFSGKYCPHRTLDLGWDRFINIVKTKLGGSMPTDLEVCLADREKFWKERDAALATVAQKDATIKQLEADKKNLEQKNAELQVKLTACENKPTVPTDPDMTAWRADGMVITEVINPNKTRSTNYKLKE